MSFQEDLSDGDAEFEAEVASGASHGEQSAGGEASDDSEVPSPPRQRRRSAGRSRAAAGERTNETMTSDEAAVIADAWGEARYLDANYSRIYRNRHIDGVLFARWRAFFRPDGNTRQLNLTTAVFEYLRREHPDLFERLELTRDKFKARIKRLQKMYRALKADPDI